VKENILPLRVFYYLAFMLLLYAPAAGADTWATHVDLVCDAGKNLVLVRFSVSYNDDDPVYPTLPPELDRGLSASTGSDRTDCTLSNGTTIRVRGGDEQAFGNGFGGGDPPAFFSLWINHRKLISRMEWKPGYAQSFDGLPVYDGVLIKDKSMTICATAEDKPQHCRNQILDLTTPPVDHIEYGSNSHKSPVGSFSTIAKGVENQRFCEAYVALIKDGTDTALRGGRGTPFDFDITALDQQRYDGGFGYSGLIELSPNVSRRMMTWGSTDHYFDGDVIALAPPATTPEQIISAYPLDSIENWPMRVAPTGFTLISGGQKQLYPNVSPRYVHLVPQKIYGKFYVLAYPTNHSNHPTAALVKPLADGGFVTLCAFNRTEPHY
jgi:hypothetical protein